MYKYNTEELRFTLLLVIASRALKVQLSYYDASLLTLVSPLRELVDSLKKKREFIIAALDCNQTAKPNESRLSSSTASRLSR